jgi:hypothetical protein
MSSLNKSYESGREHSDVAPQREVTLNHTAACDARESSQASPSPLLAWSKKLVEIIQRFGINFGEVFSSERSFLLFVHHTENALREGVSLLGGETKPFERFMVVLGDALPRIIGDAEGILSICVSSVSGQPKPLHRFLVVQGNAARLLVHDTESELRSRVAFFSKGTNKLQGGRVVPALVGSAGILKRTRDGDAPASGQPYQQRSKARS